MHHSWTKEDVLVAFYLYKFQNQGLGYPEDSICKILGITKGSMKMAISNFAALDGNPGLSNASKAAQRVYSEYKDVTQDVIKHDVVKYINRKLNEFNSDKSQQLNYF
ncbi:MAG: hypothetical protein PHF25_04810 [Candidatus Margulisbacteria bacterium]|nr:hypothetical protein [Candidatus Margulisiibacteriota bacterium]